MEIGIIIYFIIGLFLTFLGWCYNTDLGRHKLDGDGRLDLFLVTILWPGYVIVIGGTILFGILVLLIEGDY